MPMYFLWLHDSDEVVEAEGTELPDLDAARAYAKQVARELTFKRDGMLERNWSQWTMSVRNDSGEVLLSFRLSDVVTDYQPTAGQSYPPSA
jgi:hypothetical protein